MIRTLILTAALTTLGAGAALAGDNIDRDYGLHSNTPAQSFIRDAGRADFVGEIRDLTRFDSLAGAPSEESFKTADEAREVLSATTLRDRKAY